jgi:lipopolysaccharide export system protein LptA
MTGGRADIYLAKAGAKTTQPGAARLERIVAEDNVRIEQEGRRVTGQKLVYTPADDKFVMTGGPPTINDPEHGTIVGSSLTFFRADDKVLVEGGASRTVTTTRVSR